MGSLASSFLCLVCYAFSFFQILHQNLIRPKNKALSVKDTMTPLTNVPWLSFLSVKNFFITHRRANIFISCLLQMWMNQKLWMSALYLRIQVMLWLRQFNMEFVTDPTWSPCWAWRFNYLTWAKNRSSWYVSVL